MALLTLIVRLAVRNLLASSVTLVLGGVMLVGAFGLVAGSALVSSMDQAMTRSIVNGGVGHVQVFSSETTETPSIWESLGSPPRLAPLPPFAEVKKALLAVPGVQTVIPMGTGLALLSSGNRMDETLAKLREALKGRAAGSPGAAEQVAQLRGLVEQNVLLLRENARTIQEVSSAQVNPEAAAALERASAPEFWADLDANPSEGMELLENRLAPLSEDADPVPLPFMGTDLEAYGRAFRTRMVLGEPVPPGHRGLLVPHQYYEGVLKLRTARRLDRLHQATSELGKRIAGDEDLQQLVEENRTQTQEILLQLDAARTRELVQRLQAALGTKVDQPRELLSQLLATDDANLEERRRIFYEQVAPLLDLYRIRVGEVVTLQGTTQAGAPRGIKVRVYGTYQVPELERSALASAFSLLDMVSFRYLYGDPSGLSAKERQEIQELRQGAGARTVDRADAEAALFGDPQGLTSQAKTSNIEASDLIGQREDPTAALDAPFSQADIDNGVVLHAAVLVSDAKRLPETYAAMQKAAADRKLGLTLVPWILASGSVGQFVVLVKLGLYVAVVILLLVAAAVMSNAILMATLQRVREIGVMRAIGAGPVLVFALITAETMFLAALFGGAGALLGAAGVKLLGKVGIAAANEQLQFFFAGPRLHPALSAGDVRLALTLVGAVSLASALYPAIVAMRTSPMRAMQSNE